MQYLRFLCVVIFLYPQFGFSSNLIRQEIVSSEESEGMQFLYLFGENEGDFVTLDCQSFIHELKFFQNNEELINYRISDYECQELYQDLSYRMEVGKQTCLIINPDDNHVSVKIDCFEDQ